MIEKYPYRCRENLLVIYRGLQFLIKHEFEVLLNVNIIKNIIFPTLKEIVMEEYLPDIKNDMMICLIRAGSVIIRSEIWKFFLTATDGYTHEVIKSCSKRNKRDEKDNFAFQNEPLLGLKKNKTVAFPQLQQASNLKKKK